MVGKHGFEEFERELRQLAERFEDAAEKKLREDPDVRGRDPVTGEFITFREAIAGGIRDGVNKAVLKANREAKQHLPSDPERGRSSDPQIYQEAVGWQGDRYQHYFYSTNDLVAYHEFGTGQHSARGTTEATGSAGPGYYIRPRTEDVLSFEWDKLGGRRVAFEYVVHPGVRGKGFMQRALRDSTSDIQRYVANSIDNMEFEDF